MIPRINHSSFGTRGIMCTVSAFFVAFVLALIIGGSGPEVLHKGDDRFEVDFNSNDETTIVASFPGLVPENRVLYVSMEMNRNVMVDSAAISEDIDVYVGLTGAHAFHFVQDAKEDVLTSQEVTDGLSYDRGEKTSRGIFVFRLHSLEFEEYNSTITIEKPIGVDVTGVLVSHLALNPSYTSFEMGFKYTFFVITLLVLFMPCGMGYVMRLREVPTKRWSREQTWVLVLLETLVLFNDPFFAAQIYSSNSEGLAVLYIFFLASFLATFLAFVINVLDDILVESRQSDAANERMREDRTWIRSAPKFALCGVIWFLILTTFITMRFKSEDDPTYNGLSDEDLRPGEVALAIFLSIYVVHLTVLVVKNCVNFHSLAIPYRFFFLLTSFVIVLTVAGLFSGFFFPVAKSAITFMAFYALPNLYVWTLAYAYAPMVSADSADRDLLGEEAELSLSFQTTEDYFGDVRVTSPKTVGAGTGKSSPSTFQSHTALTSNAGPAAAAFDEDPFGDSVDAFRSPVSIPHDSL